MTKGEADLATRQTTSPCSSGVPSCASLCIVRSTSTIAILDRAACMSRQCCERDTV